MQDGPRGIAVLDVGASNSRLLLFDREGRVLAERRRGSPHLGGLAVAPLAPHERRQLPRDASGTLRVWGGSPEELARLLETPEGEHIPVMLNLAKFVD